MHFRHGNQIVLSISLYKLSICTTVEYAFHVMTAECFHCITVPIVTNQYLEFVWFSWSTRESNADATVSIKSIRTMEVLPFLLLLQISHNQQKSHKKNFNPKVKNVFCKIINIHPFQSYWAKSTKVQPVGACRLSEWTNGNLLSAVTLSEVIVM